MPQSIGKKNDHQQFLQSIRVVLQTAAIDSYVLELAAVQVASHM